MRVSLKTVFITARRSCFEYKNNPKEQVSPTPGCLGFDDGGVRIRANAPTTCSGVFPDRNSFSKSARVSVKKRGVIFERKKLSSHEPIINPKRYLGNGWPERERPRLAGGAHSIRTRRDPFLRGPPFRVE